MSSVTALGSANDFSDMNSGDGGTVDSGLKLDAINTKLEIESTLDDVFEELGADVVSSGKSISIPNAIYFRLGAQPTGTRTVTVPILMALSGSVGTGPGTPVGSELGQDLKYAKFYYHEYYQAVASENWGMKANDMAMYGVFEHIQPQLSKYFKELRGKRIRQAGLRTLCEVADDQGTAHWNRNFFIANTALGSQPTYDNDEATYRAAIITALDAAGGTSGDGANANIDLDYLLSLEYYAANSKRIRPLTVGGQETYVVLIPSTQVQILKRNDPGQLGNIYTPMVRTDADEMKYTGSIGRVGKLLLIEDQRYPTMVVASSALTPAYCEPGNSDSRGTAVYNGSSNKNWDIGFLFGAGAICEWVVKPLHFEVEKQNYGRDQGTGAFAEGGIATVEYDTDGGWAGTAGYDYRENFGSIVLAFTTPTITA